MCDVCTCACRVPSNPSCRCVVAVVRFSALTGMALRSGKGLLSPSHPIPHHKLYSRPKRFYTPEDLAVHNCAKDIWVSIHNRVFDLTELIRENRGPLAQPLIAVRSVCTCVWVGRWAGVWVVCVCGCGGRARARARGVTAQNLRRVARGARCWMSMGVFRRTRIIRICTNSQQLHSIRISNRFLPLRLR